MIGPVPILDKEGVTIDPIWAAEFRGFFWGEGTIAVSCRQPLAVAKPHIKWQGYSIQVIASIGLRSDDAPLLYEFHRRLGGRIRTEPYRTHTDRTITRWAAGTASDCLRIADLLKSSTGLPFLKARQLELWREAVLLKLATGATSGSRYTAENRARMREIDLELKRLRLWNG